jgi:hypothetical protein
MIVNCRSPLDDRVNVGNGDQDLGGPVGHGLGNGKLVQIARIIVVDGTPEQVPKITRRLLSLRRWGVDSVKLGERLGRKIWNKSSFKHRPMGNSLQDRAVLSVVCIRHHVAFLEYPVVISCSRNAFCSAPASFAKPANKSGLHHLRQNRIATPFYAKDTLRIEKSSSSTSLPPILRTWE